MNLIIKVVPSSSLDVIRARKVAGTLSVLDEADQAGLVDFDSRAKWTIVY